MSSSQTTASCKKPKNEKILFLKKMLTNPKTLGAILPSSKTLANKVAFHAKALDDSGYIVEVGAGTGSFTQSLLASGIDPDKLIVVELDHDLCTYLKDRFSNLMVLQGDACDLSALLPPHTHNKITTIVSGIPLINFSKKEQKSLFDSFQKVLHGQGQVIQFTYGFISPLNHVQLGLNAQKLGSVFFNIPPATLWSYQFIAS